ncbi:peptidase T, partial [Escherichia coli]|nr:peptidase T [Escherichia coli]
MEFNGHLPVEEAPEYTEGYEGFYHLLSLNGNVEQSKAYYIIRDFDRKNFEARKNTIENIVKQMQEKYGQDAVVLEMNDQYYNMLEKIEPVRE